MNQSFRNFALVALLAASASAFGQATSWVSAEWTPMTEDNARLFQQADAQYKVDVEADYQRRVADAKAARAASRNSGSSTMGAPSGASASNQNTPIPDGMRGPGEPRGNGRMPEPPSATSLEKILPAALEFAAPTSGGLIVQRMSGSVMFGRTDSDALVMLPLGGEADLPHGMRGTIREEAGQLRLNVQLPTGQVVEYRYHLDPDPSGRVMGVDISILGALPGRNVDFRRLYRRAQVNVGELKKPG